MSGVEYEAGTISAVDNARAFVHADIKSMAESLMPADAMTGALRWTEMGTRLAEVAENLRTEVTRAIGADWTGTAATSAERGVGAFGNSVTDLAGGVAAVFAPMHNLSLQSMLFLSAVPAVRAASPSDTADDSAGADQEAAQEALHQLINTGFVESDSTIPTLPPPFDPVVDDLSGGTSSTSTGGTDRSASSNAATENGTEQSTPETESRTNQSASENPADTAPRDNSAQQVAQDSSRSADSTAETPGTRQAGYVDETPQRSFMEDPIRRAGTPAPSQSTTSATPFSPVPVSPGQPVATNNPASTANSATRAVPATTRTGFPGMGGTSPATARQRDEDNEHKIPSYLVTEENGNALFGPIPKTAPPVLGA